MPSLLERANAVKKQKDDYIVPENLRAGVTAFGVTGNFSGLDTSDADATAEDITKGKTAYVDGQKVTGTNEGTIVSNIDLNVFLQENEPERKDGIWIRDGETTVSGTKFLYYDALQDEFMDNRSVRFLKNDMNCVGQVIIDDYMYIFSKTSGSSRKYNLKTGAYTTINTPSFTEYEVGPTTGCYYYKGYVYMFFTYKSYNMWIFKYDVAGNAGSIWRVGAADADYWCTNLNFYNNKLYFIRGGNSNLAAYCSYDVTTGSFTSTTNYNDIWKLANFNNITGNRSEFIYFISQGCLYRFDVTNNTFTNCINLTNGGYLTSTDNCGVYCTNDYVYIFKYNSNKYYKLSYSYNEITTHDIGFNLQIKSAKDSGGQSYEHHADSIILDDKTGKLYFRTSTHYYKGNPSVMQLYRDDSWGSNKVVVQLSDSCPFIKLENTTGLYSGFKNTYLVKDNVISSNHMMCYGDGENWNIFKNPNNDTCTVTFDLDGGTGEIESQTFVCGGMVTEPVEIPEKTDYVFDGWLLNNEIFDFSRKVLSNTTLKARWASAIAV